MQTAEMTCGADQIRMIVEPACSEIRFDKCALIGTDDFFDIAVHLRDEILAGTDPAADQDPLGIIDLLERKDSDCRRGVKAADMLCEDPIG